MDWIRNNKFLAGFLAFLLVGVGTFGYLLYTSYDHYTQVDQDYHTQVTELDRLHQLKPYPDENGLKKFIALRQSYAANVNTFQAKLAAYEPPPESPSLTPIQFADRLRKVVEDVTASAQTAGTALPDNFYMGFEQYRGSPPDAVATPLLTRELDAVNDLVGVLLKLRVDKILLIRRAPLPTEPGSTSAVVSNPVPNARPGAKPVDLVVRYPIEIAFSAQPSAFRDALNQISAAKQLYIIRSVQVKNQVDKGPPRDDSLAPSAPPPRPAAPPTPGAVDTNGVPVPPLPDPNAQGGLRYVVGLEKLDADLRIELVKVEAPTVAPVIPR